MGKIVAVLYFNRDTVEFASLREINQTQGIKTLLPFLSFSEKHYGREPFGGFSRSHNACYWLHKAISMSLSWFGDDRRSILSILSGDFLLLRRFYVLFCLYVYVYLGVKEICSSYLDLLYYRQGGGARANSKVRNRLSQQFYFHRQVYIILKTVPVWNPYAQINLLSGKGKTDRKSRTAAAQSEFHRSYSRRNKQWNKPRSCLCGHWSERSISILL